jgi:hypothetical protein
LWKGENAVIGRKGYLAVVPVLFFVGCIEIPTHNLNEAPVAIRADEQDYFTCKAYSLTEDGFFGNTSYTISFTSGADNTTITLRGVKKLTITELPEMVDAPMPTYLPDIKTDHPSDAPSYVEGRTYTWADGSKAAIKNGAWVAVKQRNTICRK